MGWVHLKMFHSEHFGGSVSSSSILLKTKLSLACLRSYHPIRFLGFLYRQDDKNSLNCSGVSGLAGIKSGYPKI